MLEVSQHTFLRLLRAYYGLSKYNFQFVCLLFPYRFNAVEAQVELFILKLNVAHDKNNKTATTKTIPKDFCEPWVLCHYPEEEKLFRPSDYVGMWCK